MDDFEAARALGWASVAIAATVRGSGQSSGGRANGDRAGRDVERRQGVARFAIKIFDVEGEKLPAHAGQTTQDFVLDTGSTAFFAGGLKEFFVAFQPIPR